MRKVEVTCPICAHKLTVYEDERGPSGMCPSCGARVEVPLSAFAVLGSRQQTDQELEEGISAPEEAPVAVETPEETPAIEVQPEAEQTTATSEIKAAPPKAAAPARKGERAASSRVSGRDLDLFEADGGPTKKVLTEYFERTTDTKQRIPLSLVLWVCLLGALVVLAAYVLRRIL